jgi:hypothetical protein
VTVFKVMKLRAGTAEALPYPDESFDFAMMIGKRARQCHPLDSSVVMAVRPDR